MDQNTLYHKKPEVMTLLSPSLHISSLILQPIVTNGNCTYSNSMDKENIDNNDVGCGQWKPSSMLLAGNGSLRPRWLRAMEAIAHINCDGWAIACVACGRWQALPTLVVGDGCLCSHWFPTRKKSKDPNRGIELYIHGLYRCHFHGQWSPLPVSNMGCGSQTMRVMAPLLATNMGNVSHRSQPIPLPTTSQYEQWFPLPATNAGDDLHCPQETKLF